MIQRDGKDRITERLKDVPAVAILGPRQVGKTTLAQTIAAERPSVYLDLQSERDRVKLSDPGYYLRLHHDKLIVLDEIHKTPEIFAEMRGVIDENRAAGRAGGQFLILGSAAVDLLRQSSESLAGRISYMELHPLTASEVPQDALTPLWLRGGYPDSFLARSDAVSAAWRADFIRTYLERDVPDLGPRIPAERLRRFWVMLAHLHGGMLNAAQLARNLEVDNKTISAYLDLLVDLLLVRRLPPWHANVGKRLVKSPKVYVRDTGLLHALLQIADLETLLAHPKLGDSWEGFVIENVAAALPDGVAMYFYRTAAGAEIDLVLDFGGQVWAVEIKRSSVPKLTRGFYLACDDIAPARRIVVHGGEGPFRLDTGVEALPLAGLIDALNGRESRRSRPANT